MKVTKGYTFDDLLLVPKHSKIHSRSDVDLSVKLPRGLSLKVPICTAPMKTVTGIVMAKTIKVIGGMAILHRFSDYNNIVADWKIANAIEGPGVIGASCGIKEKDIGLVDTLVDCGCKVVCIDVAHGDHSDVYKFVQKIRSLYKDIIIIAGNICTEFGANLLWEAGADIIRIGIGNGSVCSTRIETGNGYPQLSALDIVCNGYYPLRDRSDGGPMFITDGGVRTAGDVCKGLCFADIVMIGNLFAGTDEAPGDIIIQNGRKYKQYAGSSTYKTDHVEGVSGLVPYKGSVVNVINKLEDGIKSACSYQGVSNLYDLKTNPEFVEISNAGLVESHPHDIVL